MRPSLTDRIASDDVYVIDGAMGTVLYGRGVFVNVCYDELNLSQPDLIRSIHRDYLHAGAQILETNTFGANPIKLSSHGLDGSTEAINERAARIAAEAAGQSANVLGAIGPLGLRLEPFGPTSRDEALAYFGRQVDGLLAGNVDGFILETFSDLDELHAAFDAVRARTDLPVVAQVTITGDGRTSYGTEVETVARAVTEWGADVLGLNCSVGPAGMLDAIERMAQATTLPLSAQPNAGMPRTVGDRQIYLASPDYMARYTRRLIDAGARFVGGCCGTTPDHIKRLRAEVATTQPRASHGSVLRAQVRGPEGIEPVALEARSRWGAKLVAREFVRSVELPPPKGCVADAFIASCRQLAGAGIDAVNLLDGPRAQARMGSIPLAVLVLREVGIEPIVHYTCRDRNMLGMMSDLLGAAALGIRNLLIVTGDAPTMGPYPDATAVFDIDSIGLTNMVHRLNHGHAPGGSAIGAPTQYVIGVAANPAAVDIAQETRRFYWKVDAGADFTVTQPIFDPDQLEAFLERIHDFRVPVIASLAPLVSLRGAEFMANEVPGVSVPPHVIDRLRRAEAQGEDAVQREGIAIARETLERLTPMVQGVHVSAPSGRVQVALDVLQ
ncbi:MAG TPA: bifunctional homocysteine S-methyltransferase/methylenetetrahydrofolate reductase [Gemmatimonadales bacterium]